MYKHKIQSNIYKNYFHVHFRVKYFSAAKNMKRFLNARKQQSFKFRKLDLYINILRKKNADIYAL